MTPLAHLAHIAFWLLAIAAIYAAALAYQVRQGRTRGNAV